MTNDVDRNRRQFLTVATSVVGGIGVAAFAAPFVLSLRPSAKARVAGAPVEVDVSKLTDGERVSLEWRGQPVTVIRRAQEVIDKLPEIRDRLRDPDSDEPQQPDYARNEHRSIKPEFLVMVDVCTHLGCAPSYRPEIGDPRLGSDWPGGFNCACHGSRFDLAGRVYQGVPANLNMVIPPHRYKDDTTVVIGEDEEEA